MRTATTPPTDHLTVVLLKPSKYDDNGYVIRYRKGFLPSNTLACLHGLTEDVRRRNLLGSTLQWDVQLLDDTVQPIDVHGIARRSRRRGNKTIICLVGVQTNQYPRAADLALKFRHEGLDVLIGGFHVSGSIVMSPCMPPEIQQLIDAGVTVVAGEVEDHWGEILKDALTGSLRPLYNFLPHPPDLHDRPVPLINKRYLGHFLTSNYGTIDWGRGCPFNCSFCTIINVQGRHVRCRNVGTMMGAIRDNYNRHGLSFYFFTDDNFARNPSWESIFDGLIALREEERIPVEFMMQVDVLSYRIKDFVRKAKRAGCSQVFIGVESLNPLNLSAAGKRQNSVPDLANLISAYHREDIMTHAAYIIGFPHDTHGSVLRDIGRLGKELGVKQASFFMLTPLPGSQDHQTMVAQGIPLDPDLNRYDAYHATMPHPLMTTQEWNDAYRDAWTSFYSFENMKEILLNTSHERYWNVFKNFIWCRNSVFIEHLHPMVAGYLRRKTRLERRPTYVRESRWVFWHSRVREMTRKSIALWKLLLEMEELWLQTRKRSEAELLLIEEIQSIRDDVTEWRRLRAKELQEAYRRAIARLSGLPDYARTKLTIPSRLSLFFKKISLAPGHLTYSREHLQTFWEQTVDHLRHGRLYRVRPGRMMVYLTREAVLIVQFLVALLASGVR